MLTHTVCLPALTLVLWSAFVLGCSLSLSLSRDDARRAREELVRSSFAQTSGKKMRVREQARVKAKQKAN